MKKAKLALLIFMGLYAVGFAADKSKDEKPESTSPPSLSCREKLPAISYRSRIAGSSIEEVKDPAWLSLGESFKLPEQIESFLVERYQFEHDPRTHPTLFRALSKLDPELRGKLLDRFGKLSRINAERLLSDLIRKAPDMVVSARHVVCDLLAKYNQFEDPKLREIGKAPLENPAVLDMIHKIFEARLVGLSLHFHELENPEFRKKIIESAKENWLKTVAAWDFGFLGSLLERATKLPFSHQQLFFDLLFAVEHETNRILPKYYEPSELDHVEEDFIQIEASALALLAYNALVKQKTPKDSPQFIKATVALLVDEMNFFRVEGAPMVSLANNPKPDAKVLELLRWLENSEKWQIRVHAQLTLLALRQVPSSYELLLETNILSQEAVLRRLLEIHDRKLLEHTLESGTDKIILRIRTLASDLGKVDQTLAKVLSDSPGMVIQFLEDYKIVAGPKLREALASLVESETPETKPALRRRAAKLLR